MTASPALDRLPMSPGYFRLILRSFGDTADRRAAILDGTGVTEEMVRDPRADISLFQQARQVENVSALVGEGWAVLAPELWTPSAHGPLGVAALAAPDLAAMVQVLVAFAHVRAPFYELTLRREAEAIRLDYDLTVPLDERRWRPMIEIAFIGTRALFAAVLGKPSEGMAFTFACAEPAHAEDVRRALGGAATYGAARNAVRLPKAWLSLESPFADPTLYAAALHELQVARQKVTAPAGLRGRVERLLASLPSGRLGADAVARLLGVSRRTLVRRLAEGGVGYRQLLDAELRRRAERLLSGGAMTHAQIAEALGYTDPTSFSRARRRWFRG